MTTRPFDVLRAYVVRAQFLELDTVKYGCGCGFETETFREADEERAAAQMREHLVDDHGEQLDVGRCEKCGQPTEHFRALTHLGAMYLCEEHSPDFRP